MDLLLDRRPARPYQPNGFVGTAKRERELNDIDDLARLLDTRWQVPGLGLRFGVDALVGLVPVLGDAATGLVSAYIVYRAAQLGAPNFLLARMAGNVAIDTLIGSVPLIGSVFDVFFKANRRNIRLLRRHLERKDRGASDAH